MTKRGIWIAPVVLGLMLTGCTPKPPPLPDATPTAAAIASALITGDWSAVPFTDSPDVAVKEYGIVTAGLKGLHPDTVAYGNITYDAASNTATVALDQTYNFSKQWAFTTTASLQYTGSDGWRVAWSPDIVNPSLDGYTRLKMSTETPTRGAIMGRDGSAIVWNRPVFNVGIDKTKVGGAQQEASARALAAAVGIDPEEYAQLVANGGPQQFVIAITYRAGQVPAGVEDIPGVYAQPSVLPLAPSRMFAIGLLGSAGEATAEDIEKAHGSVQVGDIVGHSGLQLSQNAALAGLKGYTIYLAPRAAGDVMTPPSAIGPTSSASETQQILFQAAPVDGANLQTTLDEALQTKAETILAGQTEIASMVVLDSQTGAILVAANSPPAGGYSYATLGRYAPGSTFKVATALALLRTGMTPDSPIDCPTSVTVYGKPFENDADFATSHNGTITLQQAVAWSCNTAMVNGSLTLGSDALPNAAASLGLGVSRSLGFPTFMGSVPVPDNNVDKAAASFGQGTVEMSPLAMATEAASVAAGRTITPYLLVDPTTGQPWQPAPPAPSAAPGDDGTPADIASAAPSSGDDSVAADETASPTIEPEIAPLTPTEAAGLQGMMQAVVNIGTGGGLKGLAIGAKTGTAEFTDQNGQILTHAWMIAYTDKYAIAAFVNVGDMGAVTAGPLIKAFLTT